MILCLFGTPREVAWPGPLEKLLLMAKETGEGEEGI